TASFTAAAAAAAEELDIVGDHLGRVALVAFLVLPRPRAQPALHVHLAALAEVLAAHLRLLSPHHHAVPLGSFLPLALLVGPGLVGREPELAHAGPVGCVAHLRVVAEIPDENDLVDAASHDRVLLVDRGTLAQFCDSH